MYIPTEKEFLKGIKEFEKYEKRDAMYKVATFLISNSWGKPGNMADGLGVLLLTWNQAFYRFGSFDFDKLEECIAENLEILNGFRHRDISSMSIHDKKLITDIFPQFLDALQIDSGKKRGLKSPVAVAKSLHLLAPAFFPLWDAAIAQKYDCDYSINPAEKYILFCEITTTMFEKIKNYKIGSSKKTLCKLIDEYNYSRYTKGWI